MPDTIALIPTRLTTTMLGLPSRVGEVLRGRTVLAHTVARAAKVGPIERIVLLHADGEDPLEQLNTEDVGKPVCGFAHPAMRSYPHQQQHAGARKWSLTAWRGGLGGALCYDELLPVKPMLAAMEHHQAQSALLAGGDWPLVDPVYCQRVLARHLEHPEAMQMTFTQAPPGLSGIAVGRSLIEQMASNDATFGQVLAYNPAKPQADPIGRDVCVQIPASVRSCTERFIFDTPATAAMIRWVADQLNDRFPQADAADITDVVRRIDDETACGFASLPQQITLELTPRRRVSGPITPQHHVAMSRRDLSLESARRIVSQMGQDRDIALTLGGLGDALLHESWASIVIAAHEAGVLGIAVETDLLVDEPVLERLLELPIDVIAVRLNADTTATYKKVMDPQDTLNDGFAKVVRNLQWLINRRNRLGQAVSAATNEEPSDDRASDTRSSPGWPWIIQRLIKTADTLEDMETFYDRWVYFAGHAVIDPATSGCGLMPTQSPVQMAPPARKPCRQVAHRMTIHSDGCVAQCDQDWLGRATCGDATKTPLAQIWRSMRSLREAHAQGRWGQLELCGACDEWHRP